MFRTSGDPGKHDSAREGARRRIRRAREGDGAITMRHRWYAGSIAALLSGALVFTVAYPWLDRLLIQPLNFGKLTLADVVHVPAIAVAAALSLALLAVVVLVPTRLKQPS